MLVILSEAKDASKADRSLSLLSVAQAPWGEVPLPLRRDRDDKVEGAAI
jgi:hypothetical protein